MYSGPQNKFNKFKRTENRVFSDPQWNPIRNQQKKDNRKISKHAIPQKPNPTKKSNLENEEYYKLKTSKRREQ